MSQVTDSRRQRSQESIDISVVQGLSCSFRNFQYDVNIFKPRSSNKERSESLGCKMVPYAVVGMRPSSRIRGKAQTVSETWARVNRMVRAETLDELRNEVAKA